MKFSKYKKNLTWGIYHIWHKSFVFFISFIIINCVCVYERGFISFIIVCVHVWEGEREGGRGGGGAQCVCREVCICAVMRTWHVEVTGQLCGIGPLLPPFSRFRGLNSGHQAFVAGTLPAEPPCWLTRFPLPLLFWFTDWESVCSSEWGSLKSLVENIGCCPSSAQELLGGRNFLLRGWRWLFPTSLLISPHSQGMEVSQKTWVQGLSPVVTGLGDP